MFCALLSVSFETWAAFDCAADRIDARATVEAVYDGDTLRLDDQRIVRLIAINTPELAHDGHAAEPLAHIAQQAMQALSPVGSRVGLRFDTEQRDRHGRTLAHVFTEQGVNLSAALLAQGHGFAIVVAPNTWQHACYFQAEQRARQGGRGVWSHAYYTAKPAADVSFGTRGFVRIRGRVTNIGKSRKNVWLDLGRRVALKLPRSQLQHFAAQPIESLSGRDIIARGWVNFYNHKLRMTISHPAMLEILDNQNER